MGCNYTLFDAKDRCPHCGRGEAARHIGKSSAGWYFALRVYPDEGISTLADWERLLAAPGAVIRDEYGETLTAAAMLSVIKDRGREQRSSFAGYASEEEFHQLNESERGMHNLLRARAGLGRCVGHGRGPWSYFEGDFS